MPKLTADATQTIREHGITLADYARKFWTDGKWRGDTCGCPDDRCSGYHHDPDDHCGCLHSLVAE